MSMWPQSCFTLVPLGLNLFHIVLAFKLFRVVYFELKTVSPCLFWAQSCFTLSILGFKLFQAVPSEVSEAVSVCRIA